MADPYEVDDEGRPVAEADAAGDAPSDGAVAGDDAVPGADPEAQAALRRQIEGTLRAMAISTLVGLVAIVIVAIVVPSIRGVMILVGIVYVASSLAARWYLRRQFMARLKGPGSGTG